MYDILIVGSGPAGMSAAVYAVRAGKNVLVVEKEYEGTGQISYGSRVDNYLGFKGISGLELGESFRKHALELGVQFVEGNVVRVDKDGDNFKVYSDDVVFATRTVIYGAGASHRRLGAENEEELSGCGVSYCATCDGALYKGAKLVVVGGGDTALDDALYLADIAESVTLVHRRDTFRGAGSTLEKLKANEKVTIKTGVNVKTILGDGEVTGVLLDSGEELEAEGVFIAVGMVPETTPVSALVDTDEAGYIVAGEDCRTSCKGIYVVGDVRTKTVRQVCTAVADGACAVYSVLADIS